jgi:hypothetical protein
MKILVQTTGWQTPRAAGYTNHASSPFERVLRSRTAVKSDQPGPDKDGEKLRLMAVLRDAAGPPCLPELGAQAKVEETSPSVVADATMVVRNLATEVLQEVLARKGADGQSVDIQFDSRTLDGLSVHISGIERTLSITFATQSAAVEALLTQHSAELIDRLRLDGFTIGRIGILRKRPANVNRSEQRQWKYSA